MKTIFQNCKNCHSFDKEKRHCHKHKIDVVEVNSCEHFRPHVDLTKDVVAFRLVTCITNYLSPSYIERIQDRDDG